MGKRSGQAGTVEKHGCNWRGKYYEDCVEGFERKARHVVLGAIGSRTKTQAKNKMRQFLEQLGINSPIYTIPP
jgi:hypothetical protein